MLTKEAQLHILALPSIFLWIGFVCAISFMEAWVKFRAPGVTLPLGLGIGSLVFKALNKAEWVFAILMAVGPIPTSPWDGNKPTQGTISDRIADTHHSNTLAITCTGCPHSSLPARIGSPVITTPFLLCGNRSGQGYLLVHNRHSFFKINPDNIINF